MVEKVVTSPLFMDRSEPIGNSDDGSGRRALHAKVSGQVLLKGATTAARVTVVTLNGAHWTALPTTALTGRNTVLVQNQGSVDILLNYGPTEPAVDGIIVAAGAAKESMIGEGVTLYGRAASGTAKVAIEELA